MLIPTLHRLLAALAVALAFAGPAQAQAVAGPRPSELWMRAAAGGTSGRPDLRMKRSSESERRLMIGAAVGGLLGGIVGYRFCRRFGLAGDGCIGETLWWGTAAALLGGLIGATSAEDADR